MDYTVNKFNLRMNLMII